jgi:hypothetical protein
MAVSAHDTLRESGAKLELLTTKTAMAGTATYSATCAMALIG